MSNSQSSIQQHRKVNISIYIPSIQLQMWNLFFHKSHAYELSSESRYIPLNCDLTRASQEEQSEGNSQQFGSCIAMNPASRNSDHRWIRPQIVQ